MTVFIHLALTRHGTPKVPGIDWVLWPEANLSGALIHAKRVLERAIHWLLVKLFLSCWEHSSATRPWFGQLHNIVVESRGAVG